MTCAELESRLQVLLDERRPLAEAPELLDHQAHCAACRELCQIALAVARECASPAAPIPPPGFAAKVLAAWERRQLRLQWLRRGFAVAASMAFVGLAIAAYFQWRQPSADLNQAIVLAGSPSPEAATPATPLDLSAPREATVELGRDVLVKAWESASVLIPPGDVLANPLDEQAAPPLPMPNVGSAVNDGLEPVTEGARRAWSAWAKLVPLPKEERGRS